jgi:hypothetical protein
VRERRGDVRISCVRDFDQACLFIQIDNIFRNVDFQCSVRCSVSDTKQMSRNIKAQPVPRFQPSDVLIAAPAPRVQRRSPLHASMGTRRRRVVSAGLRCSNPAHILHRIDSASGRHRNVAAVPAPRAYSVSPGAVSVATGRWVCANANKRIDASGCLAPTAPYRHCRQRTDRLCRAAGACESGAARPNAAVPGDARTESVRIQGEQDGSEPAGALEIGSAAPDGRVT